MNQQVAKNKLIKIKVNHPIKKMLDNQSKKGGRKKFDKRKIQCYNYNKWGHFPYQCISGKEGKGKSKNQTNLAHDDGSDSNPVLLMVTISIEAESTSSWYLDTECSTHMSVRRDWLISFDESTKNKIRFADDNTLKEEEIGKVLIKRKDGKKSFISDVLF